MSWSDLVALIVYAYGLGVIGRIAFDSLREDNPNWTDYPVAFLVSLFLPPVVICALALLAPFAAIDGIRRLINYIREKP